jgi:hypothetical protein
LTFHLWSLPTLAKEEATIADHNSYHENAELFAWTGLTTVETATEEFETDKRLWKSATYSRSASGAGSKKISADKESRMRKSGTRYNIL